MPDERPITIKQLYPELSEEELRVAEDNVRRYVAIIWRIYERLKAEGKQWPGIDSEDFNLTDSSGSLTIPNQRSKSP